MPRTARFFLSLGNVLFSLILGAIALALCLFFFPEATLQLYKWARIIGESMIADSWPARADRVLHAIVDERLVVYMGFVLATRALVGLVLLLGARWFGGRPAHEEYPV